MASQFDLKIMLWWIQLFVLIGLMVGCTQSLERPASPPPAVSHSLPSAKTVHVNVQQGTLLIMGGRRDGIDVTGTGLALVQQTGDVLYIEAEAGYDVDVQMALPTGVQLNVENFDGEILLDDFEGDVVVHSTSGSIVAVGLSGRARLISRRGDVSVTASAGEIDLLGEYGVLALTDSHGTLTATTIMGEARYEGIAQTDDDVRLETDHGPVEVTLDEDSNVAVSISSTTGVITCRVGPLAGSMGRCSGSLGAGEGSLHVRTVNGPVTLLSTP